MVHFSYQDLHPQLQLCVTAQRYYEHHSLSTQVLAASFTSIQQVMALAGVHHMTLAPPLLEELASTSPESMVKITSLFDEVEVSDGKTLANIRFGNDEAAFRTSFARNSNGKAEAKLVQVGLVQRLTLLFTKYNTTEGS